METQEKKVITVESTINVPVKKVWEYWTRPEHIVKWNHASDDWHSPWSKNDLRVGGSFSARMEAKDGSMGFDFGGVYDAVKEHQYIEYTLGDERKVKINFASQDNATKVVESLRQKILIRWKCSAMAGKLSLTILRSMLRTADKFQCDH